MMTQPTGFSNADFESIKSDIKTFLASKTEFRDFNFEGSAISVLIDALAYTTNYCAVHANMSLTEIFLDSNQLRSSAVSHAKSLGYFPRQKSASRTDVDVTYVDPGSRTNISNIVLPAGSRFSGGNSGAFEFVTIRSHQLLEERNAGGSTVNPGTYLAKVEIREGQILERTFSYPSHAGVPIFNVPDKDIDTDYFRVYVTAPGEINPTEYLIGTDIVDVLGDTNAFFLQEALDGSIEFYFGDGIIGKKPAFNSSIKIKYLVTNGPEANGVADFSLITSLDHGSITINPSLVGVTATERSAYGAEKQDIESIKFTAPKAYAAQNRAVTEGDYQALILREFGFVETISVWGGELNDPPLYGKVLVSIKPRDGTRLSPGVKEDIKERVLDKYSVVGIIPEIVDPDYTHIQIESTVNYERERTFKTEGTLISEIDLAIETYFRDIVTKFNSVFRFSNLARKIEEVDSSILGNVTTFSLGKKITPIPNSESSYKFKFGNSLIPGSITSNSIPRLDSNFISFKDTNGRLDLYVNDILTTKAIGSVDYKDGTVILPSFVFEVPSGTEVVIYGKPVGQDIFAKQNNLIVLDASSIKMQRFYKKSALSTGQKVSG